MFVDRPMSADGLTAWTS